MFLSASECVRQLLGLMLFDDREDNANPVWFAQMSTRRVR